MDMSKHFALGFFARAGGFCRGVESKTWLIFRAYLARLKLASYLLGSYAATGHVGCRRIGLRPVRFDISTADLRSAPCDLPIHIACARETGTLC